MTRKVAGVVIALAMLCCGPLLAQVPTDIPATLFSIPNMARPSAPNTEFPAEFIDPGTSLPSNRMLDVCRTQVRISRSITADNGDGIWYRDGNTQLHFERLSQANPDLSASPECGHDAGFLTYQYFDYFGSGYVENSESSILLPLGVVNGWVLLNNYNLGFLDRPISAFSVKIQFAPLFGVAQELRLQYDPTAPQRVASTVNPPDEAVTNGWVHPDTINSAGWYNKWHLRSSPTFAIRTKVQDPATDGGSIAGAGIWEVKAAFDQMPIKGDGNTMDADGNGIREVMNQCDDFVPVQKVHPTLVSNPLVGNCGTPGFANFAERGLASTEAMTNNADFEIVYELTWGTSGASPTGSFVDGNHTANLWFMDMAHNESTAVFNFQTDNHAPCER